MLSLTSLISSYALAPGDTVYIDTGTYSNYTVTLTSADAGSGAGFVTFQGSTNTATDGTTFVPASTSSDAFDLSAGVTNVAFRNMTVKSSRYAFYIAGGRLEFEFMRLISNTAAFYAVPFGLSSNVFIRHSVAQANSRVMHLPYPGPGYWYWDNGVCWYNGIVVQSSYSYPVSVSNSAIVGGTLYITSGDIGNTVAPPGGDRNILWSVYLGGIYLNLRELQNAYPSSWQFSTVADPLFVNGPADFHPRSTTGTFSNGSFTAYASHSPLIDLGAPGSPYANEPMPNGAAVNAGRYGNTAEASMSRTNAWLFALSFNDGGELAVSGKLAWAQGGFSNGATARIEYSPDNGSTWALMTNGFPVTNGFYICNVSSITSTPVARWRISGESDPYTNVVDTCDGFFVLRGIGGNAFYVNDGAIAGDVYCLSIGSATNNGLSPGQPRLSLQSILDTYDLGPEDVIYVDTGIYSTQTVTFGIGDQGSGTNYITVQGSTNHQAGGTVFDRGNPGTNAFVLNDAGRVRLRDLTIKKAQHAVHFQGASANCIFERVVAASNSIGFSGTGTNHVFRQCRAVANGYGLYYRYQTPAGRWTWDQGVFWANGYAVRRAAAEYIVSISNSVIVGGTLAYPLDGTDTGSVDPPVGNYSVLWSASLGSFTDLSAMQKYLNSWANSTVADPLFVNGAGFDFHEKSVSGTYSNGSFITYTNQSPIIDIGDPTRAFAAEATPNGGRMNAGVYGNTIEAGMSRTNSWLFALTYRDGGTLSPPADTVRWNSGNLASGATVRIEISLDGGANWDIVATNISASSGVYAWANTNFTSSRFARWRVVLESDPGVSDSTPADMFFRNGPFKYYVNDASLAGDVYATATGSDANLGTSPGAPKLTLQSLLNVHAMQAGDIIYVDTGTYNLSSNNTFSSLDAGGTSDYVYVRGSTNLAAGGSVLNRQSSSSSAYALELNGSAFINVSDLVLRNAGIGLRINNSTNARLRRVRIEDNATDGVQILSSIAVQFDQAVFRRNSSRGLYLNSGSANVHRGIFFRNTTAAVGVDAGLLSISNSVVHAVGGTAFGYLPAATNSIIGDFNAFFMETNAIVAHVASSGRNVDSPGAWTMETGQDRNSLDCDPLFADAAGGDFHLKTAVPLGRALPNSAGFTNDSLTSPLIDAAFRTLAFTNEPVPNGARMDIGYYGDTSEASKSPTNGWLFAGSFRSGGYMAGTGRLRWVAGCEATGGTVSVELSIDGGLNWNSLSTNEVASNEGLSVVSTIFSNSPAALWRLRHNDFTNAADTTTNFFSIRNGALKIYVNDATTTGDVFTVAAGSATNYSAWANKPLDSIVSAIQRFDLEPGDTIFVDSGTYSNGGAVTFGRRDGGMSNNAVSVVGSTNNSGAATVLNRGNPGAGQYGLVISGSRGLAFSNMVFRTANEGVLVSSSHAIQFGRVRAMDNSTYGFDLQNSSNVAMRRIVAARNGQYGVTASSTPGITIEQSVIWSNAQGAIRLTGGGASVTNCVLKASGANIPLYNIQSGATLSADYNDILLANLAIIGNFGAGVFQSLETWRQVLGLERRSLSHDPLFADGGTDDFHPLSEAGRVTPSGALTNDAATSPLIDTGAAGWSFASEPAPNGSRVDIGLFGNDAEASRSRTNGWLVAITMNAGGSMRGTNTLFWVAGGATTGRTVALEYSADGGATWSNIVSGVSAAAGSYAWNSLSFTPSANARWRVVDSVETNIFDAIDSSFTLNNGPLTYYVNDASTNGDVYATVPGNDANDGTTPGTPRASVLSVINGFQLLPGDTILVDTGIYSLPATISIGQFVVGHATNPITIRGSTNLAAGGTILNRLGGAYAISVANNAGISLQHLRITNASPAVFFSQTTNTTVEFVSIFGGTYGVELDSSPSVALRRMVFRGCGRGVYQRSALPVAIENSIFWSNTYAIACDAGTAHVSNSVLAAVSGGQVVYLLSSSANVIADYNDVYVQGGGIAATRLISPRTVNYQNLSRWIRDYGQDAHSLSHDPLFADAASNDFHLKSSGARFSNSGSVTNDGITSPLIDAGAPNYIFTNELAGNGRRIDIGIFGNTAQASTVPTNAALTAISLNDGGRAEATIMIFWNATGTATGHTVKIEYSANSGESWSVVTNGLAASAGGFAWNTLSQTSSVLGRWRISSELETNANDMTDSDFALRNSPFDFFVNDTNMSGDVFAANAGSTNGSGVVATSPVLSVQTILSRYDVEGGDTIYVDTGNYLHPGTITVGEFDAGVAANRVMIRGSTNTAAGGAVFMNYGLDISGAPGVGLRDISIRNASTGLRFVSSDDGLAQRVETVRCTTGFEVNDSGNATFSNCVARNGSAQGLYVAGGTTAVNWQFGVLWSNFYGVRMDSGTLNFRNSVVGADGANTAAYFYNSGTLQSDYNDIRLQHGAWAGYRPLSPLPTIYQNVSRWVRDFGQDSHSLSHDPLFANAAQGDFHPQSVAGRFMAGGYTNDIVSSPLIDAATPSAPFANEPLPNGSRADIGCYGNDAEASLSDTNGRLTVVSLNDGGRAAGTVTLNWFARGSVTAELVSIDFSADGGISWSNIVSNIAASVGTYNWNSTNYLSTALGVWRIASSNASDQSDAIFALRNTSLLFYVNDSSTSGDVYCTGAGSITNAGVLPSSPMASLQGLISTYDLEPGDRVYIDTGTYLLTSDIAIGQFDQGSGSSRVSFIGSTNSAAGGTLINRQGGAYAFRIEQTPSIELRSLRIQNAVTGIRFDQSDNCVVSDVSIRGGSQGIEASDSDSLVMRNCDISLVASYGISIAQSQGALFESGVLWSNLYGVYMNNSAITVSNTVIGAFGSGRYAYYVADGLSTLASDRNDIFCGSAAYVAYQYASPPVIHQTLSRWTRDTGRDARSLSHDPLFAFSYAGDFHPLSTAGRFAPGGGYTNDAITSPLLDAGSKLASFVGEPSPNGARIDMGRFGNHVEASLSPSNPSLIVLSLNDGGRTEGTNAVHWIARGSATSDTLRLEFTPDDGATWMIIATGVAASAESHVWDTTLFPNSALCRWRVVDEAATNVLDATDRTFSLRNGPLPFYVNDASLAGDAYCAAIGVNTNVGVSPATPKTSIQDILDTYDLEPGDTIYIDTGNFTIGSAISIGQFDAGQATNRVTLQGSTNVAAGGTIINRFGGDYCISVASTPGIAVRHLTLRNASIAALRLYGSDNCLVEWVRAENSGYGFEIDTCSSLTMRHNVARANTARGLSAYQSSVTWASGVVWSNVIGCYVDGGSMTLRNSALGAFQSAASAFFVRSGAVGSDYNAVFVTNGAAVGLVLGGAAGGGTSRYVSVSAWSLTGRDSHSLSTDPRFANAAGGDFHLRSQAGRFVPGSGFINDPDTSFLIDAGDPASSFASEPSPNGGRLNIGLFGDSTEESKTPTNSWLTTVSLNDGGWAGGTVTLLWLVGGNAVSQLVTIAFSADGGLTYSNIVSGISASAGSYSWSSTSSGSTPAGMWRVTSDSETNVFDVSDRPFGLRNNAGIIYYVNDASTNGDVFATATGAATNLGYLASSPKSSIQDVIDSFDLEPGDRVLIDTGSYGLTADLTIGDLDAGATANPVTFEGSTNTAAGGTTINRQVATTNTTGILLYQTAGILLKNLRVINAGTGVKLFQSPNCRLSGVRCQSMLGAAFVADTTSPAQMDHCIAFNNGAGMQVKLSSSLSVSNCVVWESGTALDILASGSATVRNSLLQASGPGARVYKLAIGAGLTANFNDLIRTNGAMLAEQALTVGGSDVYQSLTSWVIGRGQDTHSLSHFPMIGDIGSGDFHPLATSGRFLPGSGYVTDAVHSVLIDTGDPSSVYTNEPAPNGGRIDIGAYGNHGEASHSRTQAWLLAVSFNDGGSLSGTNMLRWTGGNLATGELVRVDYSPNNGIDWFNIATNVAASAGAVLWDVSPLSPSVIGLWRVTSQSDTGVTDTVDNPFIIRTAPIGYYVNDASTNGDVYATEPGSSTNTGTSASSPLSSLQELMNRYPILAGDAIYIDTGIYPATNSIVFNELVRGETGLPVRIHGSTNSAAGGTVLIIPPTNATMPVIQLSQTRFIELDHLVLRGGSHGISLQNSTACSFSWLDCDSNVVAGVAAGAASPATFDHCIVRRGGGTGVDITGNSAVTWRQGLVWQNPSGAVRLVTASLTMNGSILHASGLSNFVFVLGQGAVLASDYNLLWRQNNAGIGRNTYLSLTYANMVEWRGALGQDAHTLLGDPLFAGAADGDFHELSTGGRFTNGTFVADALTSPVIDAGDPSAAFTNETAPHGGRANIGVFGNSDEASRTPATPQLVVITLADGGTVRGPVTLNWLAQGHSATGIVTLQYSGDSGATWTNIATNVSAMAGSYAWDPTGYPSSPAGRWRIVDEGDTNIAAMAGTNFFLRVGPVNFFVNDAATDGDVYCSSPGALTNLGLSANAPMAGLQQVFDAYDLDGGDVVFIDTGNFTNNSDTLLAGLDGGIATAAVRIVGSTNWTAGGTVIDRADVGLGASIALSLSAVNYVGIENITIRRAGIGVLLFQSAAIALTNVTIRECGAAGIKFDQSGANRVARSVMTRMAGVGVLSSSSSGNALDGVIIWSNGSHAVSVLQGGISVSNSVLHAYGSGRFCYADQTNATFMTDYNNLVVGQGAYYGPNTAGLAMESLPQWSQARNADSHSLSVDPLFANAAAYDFHLRSIEGRFDPVSGTFVTDTNHSYLIDTGDPYAAFTNEPAPNGGRLNIGVHGGTTEASKGRTNAWLLAITASSGGRLAGSVYLDWAWGGIAPTNTVRLDYSYDNGASWTNIVGGIAISADAYPWDSAQQVSSNDVFVSSPIARWRIVLESDTNVFDVTDSYFALRNNPFIYYVNDSSTAADVFTSGTGSDTNLGLFSYAPKATLGSLLNTLDVEGSDVILIDTGNYNLTDTFGDVTAVDGGAPGLDVIIRGSTNGTILRRLSGAAPVLSVSGPNVRLRDVAIANGQLAISGSDVDVTSVSVSNGSVAISGARDVFTNAQLVSSSLSLSGAATGTVREVTIRNGGVTVADSAGVTLQNLLISGTATEGVNVQGNSGAVAIRNCTIVVSGHQFRLSGSATVTFENNIAVASGAGNFCLLPDGGLLLSDYNNLVARSGAWIGSRNGLWERLSYWQRESGQDANSLSHEPLFANESIADYHLKSTTGRHSNGVFVVDSFHSPSIDAGRPTTNVGVEMSPNGSRINQGAFGGTVQASRSQTNAWLLAMSPNDGGVIKGTSTIRWNGGNLDATNTVSLQYSADSGTSWVNIASGLAATNGAYSWNTTAVTSSLTALWRVMLDGSTNVNDTTDNQFAVRNNPLNFYVNDSSTLNDVFTSAIGSPVNNGLSAAKPKNSIMGILNAYDTEGGDTIFVDTGTYNLSSDVFITWSRGGDASSGPLRIEGSTNFLAGGAVMVRGNTATGTGIEVAASHVTLRNLAVRDAWRGFLVSSSRAVRIERSLAYSNEYGIAITQSVGAVVANDRLWNNRRGGVDVASSSSAIVENCTFAGNLPFGYRSQGSTYGVLQNNIFILAGSNTPSAIAGQLTDVFIDYNLYDFQTNALIHSSTNATLMAWQLGSAHDYRSAMTNARLANIAAGDFHEQSTAGRWVDGTGFVADVVNSWAIDHGNPTSVSTNETAPGQARINLGAYGNTEFAGKGSTNIAIELRTLNDAIAISETNSLWPLIWSAQNVTTGELFRLQYSGDNGATWTDLQAGISPYGEIYLWQTTPYYNTYRGRWRVISQTNTNIVDTNDQSFQIFYGNFEITSQGLSTGNLSRIVFRGAWGENYRIQYTTNIVAATPWTNAPNGPGTGQLGTFTSTNGGDFLYEDIQSTNRFRLYRVILDQD